MPSLNGLGGGQGTWENFSALILELNPKYVVFEFSWVTSARFEDYVGVADGAADNGSFLEPHIALIICIYPKNDAYN